MTYLSDTARVVLAAAAQRDDLSVLPFPDGVKAKGGAEQKVLTGLLKRGLVRVVETEGRPDRFVITREGMLTMNIEPDEADDSGPAQPDTGATAAEAGAAGEIPAEATKADTAAAPAARGPDTGTGPAATRTPRAGTKQAQMIELLKRPEGATIEQIAEATGWQHHTIRGAISGALKKKLGLNVTSEKPEVGERRYRIEA
jgi:hypothetical protein